MYWRIRLDEYLFSKFFYCNWGKRADRPEIGDISERAFGDRSFCVLSPNVYISDANHKHTDIMLPILDQGVSTRDEVIIEENCWIGINSVVMSSIGRGSTIGANSVVIDVVPPFSLAVGNPATVKRMYNPMTKTWDSISFPEDIKKMLEVRTKVGIPNKLDYHSILCQNSRVKLGLWAAGCT